MNFVPVACLLLVPSGTVYIVLVWLFIGVSLPAYLASWFFLRVFGKYAPLEPATQSNAD